MLILKIYKNKKIKMSDTGETESQNLYNENSNLIIENNLEDESKSFFDFINNYDIIKIKNFLNDNKHEIWKYKEDNDETVIHVSIKLNDIAIISTILAYCQTNLTREEFSQLINEKNTRGVVALHYASFHAHKDTIRFICKYDADYDKLKNTKNTQNKLPIEILSNYNLKPYFYSLWHAAREGDLDMTRRLIESENQNPNEATYFEQNTPLHLAVLNNHFLEVRLLLQYKANPDAKNKDGIIASDYARLMTEPIHIIFKKCKDLDRETFDLTEIIKNLTKKSDEFVKATVCEKNKKIRVWTANDFNEKIVEEFKNKSLIN